MSSFMQADIFFFITSIAVVGISILLVVIAIQLIKILQNLRDITDNINEEVQTIKQDIDDLRTGVRDRLEIVEKSPFVSILGSIISHFRGNKPKKTRKRNTKSKKK